MSKRRVLHSRPNLKSMDCQHKIATTATDSLSRLPMKLRPKLYSFRLPSSKDCLLVGRVVALSLHFVKRQCMESAQAS